jgi:hypothetical protein
MHRSLLLAAGLLACSFTDYAQTDGGLYTPRDVRIAYKKGTRSTNGQPGPNYWQNTGRYDIQITALPPDRNIKGTEQIDYTNNSPDTLKSLTIRIIQNVHRPGAARFGVAAADYLSTGTIIDRFAVNGKEQPWTDQRNATVSLVRLSQPLLPHSHVQLAFDWHYTISLQSGREGMLDSTTYYLAYFYPRVSVYDDYNGWDRINFTDYQEFYNDFNDYTLKVSVPANFIVWSTGTLQNPSDVLTPEFAQKMQASMTADDVHHIATLADVLGKKVTTQNAVNTWVWTASDISDMTVALSDHYVWDGTSVVVDDATGRRTAVQAAYNDTAKDFHQMAAFGSHAIGWFSHNWPGVAYPFPKLTAVQGQADMEYPMMINDGTTDDPEFTRLVADHEIAHTYFPFYMGINESRFAFMDEGWATTLELLIGRTEIPVDSSEAFYKAFRVERWINDPSMNEDLPIITPMDNTTGVAYGNNAYGKPSLGYLALKDMLGDQLFAKALHTYMDRWHGKHPIPWDFFYSINDGSGMNLNWFWKNWYFSNGYIDLALKNVTPSKDGYEVTVENIGGFDAPFNLNVTYTDGTKAQFHKTPAVWSKGDTIIKVPIPGSKKIKSVNLDGGIFMDADYSNNNWTATM